MDSKSVIEGDAASHRRHQVCIFGAGPAGLAASARLLDCGRDVVVFERAPMVKPWGGESFTGAIRAPLKTLGMWDVFRRAGHVEGHERQWAWGGEPQVESAIFEPHGALWHVDRDRFDGDLRLAVHQRGGLFHAYRRLDSVTKLAGKWQIKLDSQYECTADFIVDATGRTRALARRLDARVVSHDHLIALTAAVPREESDIAIRSMLVASTTFGWWYTSPTPKGHVVALLTDPDLAAQDVRYRLRPVPANSAFTYVRAGEGWAPVGDACASHDPLCGCGVCRALENGILLADAIDAWLSGGNSSPITEFHQYCERQYNAYLKGLADHYAMEQRWPVAPFWKRRHQSASR
jgi:flavin-dependent dehydrogenase